MFLVICIAVIERKGSFGVTETVIVCTYIMEGIRKKYCEETGLNGFSFLF